MKFLENIAQDLQCVCMPETCRLVGWWCGHFQIVELLMKVSLISNNSDTSKIHFVVFFVDMADLEVIVEHRNCPFMFCNPSFQWLFNLTVLYKAAVVQLILYTLSDCGWSTFSWAFCHGNKLLTVLNTHGLKATLNCCCCKICGLAFCRYSCIHFKLHTPPCGDRGLYRDILVMGD